VDKYETPGAGEHQAVKTVSRGEICVSIQHALSGYQVVMTFYILLALVPYSSEY
jgi:hypothetical protein